MGRRTADDALERRQRDGGEVASRERHLPAVGQGHSSASPGHAGSGSVQQVCATLLALAGLPPVKGEVAGRRCRARPRPSARRAADYRVALPSDRARDRRPRGTTRTVDADTRREAPRAWLHRRREANTSASRTRSARTAGSLNNEGLLLKEQGRKAEAIDAFDHALTVDPNLASALWNLSDLLFADSTDLDRSDLLLVRAFGAGLPEGTKYLIGRAIGYQRSGQIDRSTKILEAALRARPEEPEVWLFLGRYRVEKGGVPAGGRGLREGDAACAEKCERVCVARPRASLRRRPRGRQCAISSDRSRSIRLKRRSESI